MPISIPKIDNTNVSDRVYDWLKESIVDLTFPPGHKLNIRQLSRDLGVSSSPITHAIYRLAGEGMIEITPRKETRVKSITKQDIREIWDARVVLEIGALEMIHFPLNKEELMEIRRCYQASLREEHADPNSYKHYVEMDYQFHLSLISLARNKRLIGIYEQLNAHMQLIRYGLIYNVRRNSSRLNSEHLRILESLEKGDPSGAKTAIKDHITRLKSLDFNLEAIQQAMQQSNH
jgi:DNA-binding GntR family transcriptional regulator